MRRTIATTIAHRSQPITAAGRVKRPSAPGLVQELPWIRVYHIRPSALVAGDGR
jgi:hypothetical protein